MTNQEYEIECAVERMTDRLDRRYMNCEFSDSQYHEEIHKIAAWAETQYATIGEQS